MVCKVDLAWSQRDLNTTHFPPGVARVSGYGSTTQLCWFSNVVNSGFSTSLLSWWWIMVHPPLPSNLGSRNGKLWPSNLIVGLLVCAFWGFLLNNANTVMYQALFPIPYTNYCWICVYISSIPFTCTHNGVCFHPTQCSWTTAISTCISGIILFCPCSLFLPLHLLTTSLSTSSQPHLHLLTTLLHLTTSLSTSSLHHLTTISSSLSLNTTCRSSSGGVMYSWWCFSSSLSSSCWLNNMEWFSETFKVITVLLLSFKLFGK